MIQGSAQPENHVGSAPPIKKRFWLVGGSSSVKRLLWLLAVIGSATTAFAQGTAPPFYMGADISLETFHAAAGRGVQGQRRGRAVGSNSLQPRR